jgi:hypothetical protein
MAGTVNSDMNPSNNVQGTSPLYRFGTSPNTRTAISQKVRILTPSSADQSKANQIGVLGQFNVSMSRNTEPVRGIGFGDKIAELVPNVQDPVQIQWERALLYLSNIFQAVGYKGGVDGPVRTLAHHRWPFDVKEELVFSELSSDEAATASYEGLNSNYNPVANDTTTKRAALITFYEACWITSTSRNITKDQSIIMENGDFQVTDIHAGQGTISGYNEAFKEGGARVMSQRYAK